MRYQRYFADISITPVFIIGGLQTVSITGVTEMSEICRWYRFLWPWFSL